MVRHGQERQHERRHSTLARTEGGDSGYRDGKIARSARASGCAPVGGTRRDGRDQYARQHYPRRSKRGRLIDRWRTLEGKHVIVDPESDQHVQEINSVTRDEELIRLVTSELVDLG